MEQVQDNALENCVKIHHISISKVYLALSISLPINFFFSEWFVFKHSQILCSYIKTDKPQLFGHSLLQIEVLLV